MQINTKVYIEQLFKALERRRINTKTKRTKKILDRVQQLRETLLHLQSMSSEDTGIVYLYGHKTDYFLRRENKITALAYYRKKLNKTQEDCADAIGVTLHQYQRYESTDSHLGDAKYSVVEKLANFLQVEPNMLVKNGLIILNSNE